jgi:Fe2+ transport system protein FeoA
MTLGDCRPNQHGIVKTIQPDHPLSLRLLEQGVGPGCAFRVLARAPWGDPMNVAFEVAVYSIRSADARCIGIELAS